MDSFYISHGSPMLSIDESLPARPFLQSWEEKIMRGQRPTSILIVSAHWDTPQPTLNLVPRNHTIYDFYGFPKSLYKLKYPAPGAPDLVQRVRELLLGAGVAVNIDQERGLDHGAWVPLMLMYPAADIPVCQLSVQSHRDATYHYNIGRALAPLRQEGVLIIGSGSATHNLGALNPNAPPSFVLPWAREFDAWLTQALLDARFEDVNDYLHKAPHPTKAHPWPEHFYPLHVAMGAAGPHSKAELIHHSWSLAALSYASYQFSSTSTSTSTST